jgi:hypothetical protein
MRIRRLSWPTLALLASLCGCGSDNGLDLAGVRGRVTLEGKPVRYGYIMFAPDGSKQTQGPPAMSKISEDGSYAISTQEAEDGAVVGTHQVSIIALDPTPLKGPAESPAGEDKVKHFFATKGQMGRPQPKSITGPTFKTRDGSLYRILSPEKLKDPNTSGISVEVASGRNTLNFAIQADGTVSVER